MGRSSLLAAALAGALALAGSGVALAAPGLPGNCTQADRTVTCRYTSTGAEQTFTVPSGVASVQVAAIGGAGGAARLTEAVREGGNGAEVAASLVNLREGTTLYLEVGGNGTNRVIDPTRTFLTDAKGGFNGGGDGGQSEFLRYQGGAGGGGASDVRTAPRAAANSLDTRLLVAGGGGGGIDSIRPREFFGGRGGDAGSPGNPGVDPSGFDASAEGGGAGTATSGGAGGNAAELSFCVDGVAGGPSQGGGANQRRDSDGRLVKGGGGGGGGGLFGGGSGALNRYTVGGGGGGSSLVPPGGTIGVTEEAPSITITYTTDVAINYTSGAGQSAPTGQAFAQALVVTTIDPQNGRPIPGVPVKFNVELGTASFAGNREATVISGADGRATSPPLTAGNNPGFVLVNARLIDEKFTAFYLKVTAAGSTQPAPPTATGAAVKGGGTLAAGGQRYSVALDTKSTANGQASGRFALSGGGADTTVASRTMTAVTKTPTGATVSGTAVTAAGKTVPFTITVLDRPGGRDQVTAQIGGKTVTGTLTSGDITAI